MSSSGIPGSYGSSIFSFSRNLHSVLHGGCSSIHSLKEGSLFSTPSPAFIDCRFFDGGHSDWCEVIPHCSLICISPMISDVEHPFRSLLAICISLEKCLFRSSAHFCIGLLFSFDIELLHELLVYFGD